MYKFSYFFFLGHYWQCQWHCCSAVDVYVSGKPSWLIRILTATSSRRSWLPARRCFSRKLCHICWLQNVLVTCIRHHCMVDSFRFLSGQYFRQWSST